MERPHLVLVHGWLSNPSCWDWLLRYLHGYPVTVIALPGHNNLARGTFFDFDALIGIVAEQVPDHSVWIGWSLGGLIAQLVASRYPHKVAQLICISCGLSLVENPHWSYGMPKDDFERFKKSFIVDNHRGAKEFIALQSLGDCRAKLVRNRLVSCMVDDLSSGEILAGLNILERIDTSSTASAYRHRITFIVGEEDRLVSADDIKKSITHLRGNTSKYFLAMQGVAHSPLLSEPAKLSNIIEDQLRQ